MPSQPYGWDQVAILHATEIPVPGSLSRCIRVLVHAYSRLAPDQIKHCYLRRATALRPDRAQSAEVSSAAGDLPLARVTAKGASRWVRGHPWIYRSDVLESPATPDSAGYSTPRRNFWE